MRVRVVATTHIGVVVIIQSGVFGLSFVSFFSSSCVCVKKILSSLVFFVSPLFVSRLFFSFFLFSCLLSVKIRSSFCIKKSKARRQLENLSRTSSSKILAATHLGATFIVFVWSFGGGGLFMSSEK